MPGPRPRPSPGHGGAGTASAPTTAVRLEFAPDPLVPCILAGPAFTGNRRWVAGDEACGLDRLRLLAPVGREALRFGEVRAFPLAHPPGLPGTAGAEADLEGMAVAVIHFTFVLSAIGTSFAERLTRERAAA